MVQRYVAKEIDLETVARLERHIGLIVEIQRVVFSSCLQRGEKRIVLLQTHSVELCEFFRVLSESE